MLKKGLLVIAVPFLFQFVFLAALWQSQEDGRKAQDIAIHTKDVIAKAEAVARYLTESQSAARGLIVTGDPAMSAAFEGSAVETGLALVELRKLVDDNPLQRARVDEIGREARAFLGRLGEMERLARGGRRDEAVGRVRELTRAGTAAAIRRDLDVFLDRENRLDTERRAALGVIRSRQRMATAAGAVVSVLTAVVLVAAFSRGFARRIAVMGDNARRLADGRALAPPIGGGDEIGRLDAVFHAMARALAEKDQENELFIYSVSHDLRSPLVNLQGFSKELALTCDDLRAALGRADVPADVRARAEGLLDRDMNGSIRFIQNAVTRLSGIIDALLRLSRAGRVVYRMQPVDVAAAVGRVVEALRATTAERGAEVVVGDLPPAWGDPTAVEQVFANLIGNAVNYLDPARPGRVEVGALGGDHGEPGAGLRTYYVKDNGLGVPEAYRAKLFLAFQRLHPGVAPGEGIGLALVRRAVERHGGTIRVDSEEGAGSTFYVTLPAPPADGVERAAAAPVVAVTRSPLPGAGALETEGVAHGR